MINTNSTYAYSAHGLYLIDQARKANGLPTLAEERKEEQIKGVMKDFDMTRDEAKWFLGYK